MGVDHTSYVLAINEVRGREEGKFWTERIGFARLRCLKNLDNIQDAAE